MITAIALVVAMGVAHGDSDEAVRLWSAGKDLANAKDYAGACAKFTRAFELDPRPGYEANLADCHRHLDHFRKAWQLYLDAAVRWDSVDADKAQVAREAAARVAQDATALVIGVSRRDLPDLTIRVNGERVTPRGEIREIVDPGKYEVVVTARGYRKFRRAGTAAAHDSVVIEVELVPGPTIEDDHEPDHTPPPPPPPEGSGRHKLFVRLALGLGVGALATGGVGLLFAFEGAKKYDDAKTGPHCDGMSPPTCDAAGSAALADGQRLADFGTYLGIGAGVLAAGAIAFYVFAPSDVQIAPTATASSAGLSASWRF